MVALFLDDNKTNDDEDGKDMGKKIMFSASRYFVQFFAVVAPLRHETSSFCEPALLSTVNTTQKLSLSFRNLDNHRYGPKENFAKICQIK